MNYKAEAEKIVEMFMPYASDGGAIHNKETRVYLLKHNAIHCAIKHVEALRTERSYAGGMGAKKRCDDLTEILNQLKQM